MAVEAALFFYFIRDNLRDYTENFRFIDKNNPFAITLNDSMYSIHVSSIHFAQRDNPDEFRIQVDRSEFEELKERQEKRHRISFIGVFDGGEVFVGWEPRYGFALTGEKRVSLYCRHSQLGAVRENLNSVHTFNSKKLGDQTSAIALPSGALGFYLENIEHFHALPSEDAITRLLHDHSREAFADSGLGTKGEFDIEEGDKREKFTYTRTSYPRDPRFKRWVLDAYAQACCICNRQLGIVEAAHIIPHSIEGSPNCVRNGLALCIEHHRLYDDALLLPGPGRTLFFNPQRAEYLRQTNQHAGLDQLEEYNGQHYSIPDEPEQQPRDEFLEQGLSIRMGD